MSASSPLSFLKRGLDSLLLPSAMFLAHAILWCLCTSEKEMFKFFWGGELFEMGMFSVKLHESTAYEWTKLSQFFRKMDKEVMFQYPECFRVHTNNDKCSLIDDLKKRKGSWQINVEMEIPINLRREALPMLCTCVYKGAQDERNNLHQKPHASGSLS